MGKFILESDFYKRRDDGVVSAFYLEEVEFCHYAFSINDSDKSYNQIGFISNSFPLYSRSFPCVSGHQWGHGISPESTYANYSEEERNRQCPKIAWGFSSYVLHNIIPDNQSWPNNITKIIFSEWKGDFKLSFDKIDLYNYYMGCVSQDYATSLKTLAHDGESELTKQISIIEFLKKESKHSWEDTQQRLMDYLFITIGTDKSKLLYDYVKKLTEDYIDYINTIFDSLTNMANGNNNNIRPIGFRTYK